MFKISNVKSSRDHMDRIRLLSLYSENVRVSSPACWGIILNFLFTHAVCSKGEHCFSKICCAEIYNKDIRRFFRKLCTEVFLKNCLYWESQELQIGCGFCHASCWSSGNPVFKLMQSPV